MLWKFLLALLAVFNGDAPTTPNDYAPQTEVERAAAHQALYGNGNDMIFPDDFSHAGIRDTKYRWNKNILRKAEVPYVIHKSLSNHTDLIKRAMDQYHKLTCIKFIERTNERDFIILTNGRGCNSNVGKIGGQQTVNLQVPGCIHLGTIVHELGHAIGLYHEHQRSDRDTYITVYKNNVKSGQWLNFKLEDPATEIISTPYNYDSIMHYGNYAFSKEDKVLKTMEAKNGHKLEEPYGKPGLHNTDVDMIKKLYKC